MVPAVIPANCQMSFSYRLYLTKYTLNITKIDNSNNIKKIIKMVRENKK